MMKFSLHGGRTLLANSHLRGLATRAGKLKSGDTEFVQRRRVQRELMHQSRVSFIKEQEQLARRASEIKEREKADVVGQKRQRAEQKRARSLAKQENRLRILEEVKMNKAVRVEYRRKDWLEKQKALEVARKQKLDMLAAHAHTWITEDNVDEEIERVVDAFFIEPAMAHLNLVEADGRRVRS